MEHENLNGIGAVISSPSQLEPVLAHGLLIWTIMFFIACL